MPRRAESVDFDWLGDSAAALGDALEACDWAATMVRAMAEFARPSADTTSAVDVGRLLTSLAALTRNEWKYVADLTLDVPADLPVVKANEGTLSLDCLEQILSAARALREHPAAAAGNRSRLEIDALRDGDAVVVRIQGHPGTEAVGGGAGTAGGGAGTLAADSTGCPMSVRVGGAEPRGPIQVTPPPVWPML